MQERQVAAGAIQLHIAEAGPADGPLVILLHGFPEFWWSWRGQIGALADAGFHVVAPDMRGYGGSDCPDGVSAYRLEQLAADVVALAEALGAGRFRLVGHDWGGIVAWAVAAYHPERLLRLVAINAPHLDVMPEVLRRRPGQLLRSSYIGFFQLPLVPEAVLRANDFAALVKALTGSSRAGTFTAAALARYREAWSGPGRLTAMLNYYRALVRRPHRPLGRIEPETLILWGRRDQALVPELAEASVEQCRAARLEFHPDASHWVHLEEPDWINRQLLSFLGQAG